MSLPPPLCLTPLLCGYIREVVGCKFLHKTRDSVKGCLHRLLYFVASLVIMDPLLQKVTVGESKIFHGVDRELYTFLVRDLRRNPLECLQIMGLWLWLERLGTSRVINKVRAMPPTIIDILADEAITCLKLLNNGAFMSFDDDDVPFTNNILKKAVSMQFFINYHDIVLKEIHDLVIEVCIPVLADIVETARGNAPESSTQNTRSNPVPVSSVASSSSSSSNVPRTPGPTYYSDPFALNFSSLSIKGDGLGSSPPSNPLRSPDPVSYANPFDFGFSASIIEDINAPPLCNKAPLPAYVEPRAPKESALSIPGVANATPHLQNRPQLINMPQYSPPTQNRGQLINRPEYSRPVVSLRQANRPEFVERVLAPHQPNIMPEHSRTMFATFSKGYPVSEAEIKQFFTALLGECIQGLYMQEVEGEDEQPLYARIVFANQSFIHGILNGQSKAKFNINGKHVWIRRFVPRNSRGARPAIWVPPRLR